MSRLFYVSIGLALALAAAPGPSALAQDQHGEQHSGGNGGEHDGGHDGGHGFSDGDDFDNGYGGNWRQGWDNEDWGWSVEPSLGWYSYGEPVYPAPNPYVPPGYAVAPGAGSYWYYCVNPPGYYPYVAQCSAPWQPVVPQSPGPG